MPDDPTDGETAPGPGRPIVGSPLVGADEPPAVPTAPPTEWAAVSSAHPDAPVATPPPEGDAPIEPSAPAGPPPVPAGAGVRIGCAALELVLFGLSLGVGWLVWWVALWHRGSSPARSLLRLQVRSADGTDPGWRTTAGRELVAKLLAPLAPISAVVWLRGGHRGIADRVAGTTVVDGIADAPDSTDAAAEAAAPA